ncbi:PLP-dependent transferase [Paraclostridium sp. AKS81]|uniref:PLP-dependent transferase n=1 Tax=Paraclostridium sp. AKS81 TaxID=2876117 RepID=UPI002FCD6156
MKKVYYTGLKKHKGHEIQKKQSSGFGGVISFVLNDDIDHEKFVNNLKLIIFGESLGGIESLICHPASMTHAALPKELRERIGITEKLIRLSVGIEDKEDILKDIEQALIKAGEKDELL